MWCAGGPDRVPLWHTPLSFSVQALKAVTEIASEGPAALERFKDEPALYNALKKLFDL